MINEDGETELIIDDFRELGLQWLKHIGDSTICNCSDCNKLFKKKSNKQKVCNVCAKEKQKQWQRDSMKKLREINKK